MLASGYIVVVDYPLDLLCATVVEQSQVTFAAMGSYSQEYILVVQPSSAAVQRVFSLVNSGRRIKGWRSFRP